MCPIPCQGIDIKYLNSSVSPSLQRENKLLRHAISLEKVVTGIIISCHVSRFMALKDNCNFTENIEIYLVVPQGSVFLPPCSCSVQLTLISQLFRLVTLVHWQWGSQPDSDLLIQTQCMQCCISNHLVA